MNKVLDRLMVDLSVRTTNSQFDSGLGGNPSEFFFLLTHNVTIVHPNKDNICFKEQDGIILIFCPKDVTMSRLRHEFSSFYDQHADKREVNFDQLSDVSFLRDIRNPSLNLCLLMKCITLTNRFASSLKNKEDINKAIDIFFRDERTSLEKDLEIYLSWIEPPYVYNEGRTMEFENMMRRGVTEEQMMEYDIFKDSNKLEKDLFHSILNSLPAFKERNDDLKKRKETVLAATYSAEDDKLINKIISFPRSIMMLCIRKLIGIETIVKFNLDTKLTSLCSSGDDDD